MGWGTEEGRLQAYLTRHRHHQDESGSVSHFVLYRLSGARSKDSVYKPQSLRAEGKSSRGPSAYRKSLLLAFASLRGFLGEGLAIHSSAALFFLFSF